VKKAEIQETQFACGEKINVGVKLCRLETPQVGEHLARNL